jgi:hypothetical protein
MKIKLSVPGSVCDWIPGSVMVSCLLHRLSQERDQRCPALAIAARSFGGMPQSRLALAESTAPYNSGRRSARASLCWPIALSRASGGSMVANNSAG